MPNEVASIGAKNCADAAPTFTSWLRNWLSKNDDARTPANQLIREYEIETKKRLTQRAYQMGIRTIEKAGLVVVQRHEQLWIQPMLGSEEKRSQSEENSMHSLNLGTPRIHSAHKIRIPITYQGNQPIEGAWKVAPFGRWKTSQQAWWHLSHRVSLHVLPKTLILWVHNPKGQRTEEQMIQAKVDGFMAALEFAKDKGIKLVGDIGSIQYSHHVVETKTINEGLAPLFKKHGEEIEERVGSKVCPSSHKGKIEHEGKKRMDRLIMGKDIAKGFEFAFLDLEGRLEFYFKENARAYSELKQILDAKGVGEAQMVANITLLVKAEIERQKRNV